MPDPAGTTDAGRRGSEAVTLALLSDPERARNSWLAIKLEDGSSDNVLYDRKYDAVKNTLHYESYGFIKIPPMGITPFQMSLIIERWKHTHKLERMAAIATLDSGEDVEVIIPMRREEM